MCLSGLRKELDSFFGFSVDTMVVVLLLGVELGRSVQNATFETLLLLITIIMVAALPYVLLAESDRPSFAKWLTGRALVSVLAISCGLILGRLGTVVPESVRSLPLTLLILAGMTSCFIQFYGLMRLRLAK